MGEYKIIDVFEHCGLKTTYAKTLTYLIKNKETTSREIEREMDLRQPQVSIALNEFQKRNWIKKTRVDHDKGKGRPIYLYKLTSREQIIDSHKEKIKKNIDKNTELLKKLQKLKEEL